MLVMIFKKSTGLSEQATRTSAQTKRTEEICCDALDIGIPIFLSGKGVNECHRYQADLVDERGTIGSELYPRLGQLRDWRTPSLVLTA